MTRFFIACFLLSSALNFYAYSQTPGLIVKPATGGGTAVLDPNGDGYVSATNTGFVSDDRTESEIPFQAISVPQVEPTSDLATGPSCKFTDFVDDGTRYSAASYLDASNNFLFRFRLGGYSTNSKGYSILIDTDGLFGNTGANADPNYNADNPGFEIEIILVTNQGVRLYDVDGRDAGNVVLMEILSYDDYSQKSIAQTTACGDLDFFYDFYVPFSRLTTHFSINTSTTLRMVANTVISTQSAIKGPVSDVGGVDDNTFGNNTENMWTEVITGQVPTSADGINSGFPPIRSDAPNVTGPILSGATSVSGTSTEAAGTTIRVFADGVEIGTTTVDGSGNWTLTGITALTSGQKITATATAPGESESLVSSEVEVGATCSSAPVLLCTSRKGVEGYTVAGADINTQIRIYATDGSIVAGPFTLETAFVNTSTRTFAYNCTNGVNPGSGNACTSGGSQCLAGTFYITAQETGKCESAPVYFCTLSGGGTASTSPTITTNPIEPTTTTVSGTATAGATIYLFIDGTQVGSTTTNGSGNWNFTGQTFTLGQTIGVRALEAGRCITAEVTRAVTQVTQPPVVSGSIVNGATSASGTSTEAAGTTITVYKNGSIIGTTTVDANGNWTLSGIATPLVTGDAIVATALATGKTVSANSNQEIVIGQSPTAPVITGAYTEGGTSVNGTATGIPLGATVNVYIDGVLLGTAPVVDDGSGNPVWNLTGLSAAEFELYTDGVLTATATEAGLAESAPSNSVTVQCLPPLTDRSLNLVANQICESTTAEIQLLNSEPGVIYTVRNNANTQDLGSSTLGTGGTVSLLTTTLTSTQTLRISALKIPNITCGGINSNTSNVTVNANPLTDRAVSSTDANVVSGSSTTITVENTQGGFQYQLRNNADNSIIGTQVSGGNGSNVTFNTGAITSSTTFNVYTTDITQTTNCALQQVQTVTVGTATALPVDLLDFKATTQGKTVKLHWITLTEEKNDHFVLESSKDGVSFQPVGKIKSKGNGVSKKFYTYQDYPTIQGTIYYRLKQVDFDQSFKYSGIEAVKIEASSQRVNWQAYPNPFTEHVTFFLPGKNINQEKANYQLLIYNSNNKLMRSQAINDSRFVLQRGDLAKGLYVYKILRNSLIHSTGKLIVN